MNACWSCWGKSLFPSLQHSHWEVHNHCNSSSRESDGLLVFVGSAFISTNPHLDTPYCCVIYIFHCLLDTLLSLPYINFLGSKTFCRLLPKATIPNTLLGVRSCCLRVSIAAMTKKQVGEVRVYLAFTSTSLFIERSQHRTQGRNLDVESDVEAMEGCCLLPCPSCLLTEPRTSKPGMATTHNGPGPPHQSQVKTIHYRLAQSPIL